MAQVSIRWPQDTQRSGELQVLGTPSPRQGSGGRTLAQPAATTEMEGFFNTSNPEGQSISRQTALDPEWVQHPLCPGLHPAFLGFNF